MKISRRGSSADFGSSSIEINSPTYSWNKEDACLNIKQTGVRDFSTESHHNYTLQLSFSDIQQLLNAISEAAIADPAKFEKELGQSIKSVVRIKAVLAGIVQQPA
jgi:hypothetical protein